VIPRCPHCRAVILQKSLDGKIKIRTNIVVFDEDRAIVKCRRCKTDVPVDVQLGAELRKALNGGPRLVVRNSLDGSATDP